MAARNQQQLSIGQIILDDYNDEKYILKKKLGKASLATVYKAKYIPKDQKSSTFIALKMISMDELGDSIPLVEQLDRSYKNGDHNNILGYKNWSFMSSNRLFCVTMHYMDEGSLEYIILKWFKNGMHEDTIAIVLREAIRGLDFIHSKGCVHKRFSAGNIFVNGFPTSIMLAYEATMYNHDPDDDEAFSSTISDHDAKMSWAPEAYKLKRSREYEQSADIWLVGVTALVLAYGLSLPVNIKDRDGFNAFVNNIIEKNKLPPIDQKSSTDVSSKGKILMRFLKKLKSKLKPKAKEMKEEEKGFSKAFVEMVIQCLDENPKKRPTAKQLLQCEFLKKSKGGLRYFQKTLVNAKKLNAESN